MNVPQITVDREQAQLEYEAYRDALKTKKDAYLHDLKVAYGHMRHGRAVLDVWQAITEQGVDANGDPKLAIARCDWTRVELRKYGGHQNVAGVYRPVGDDIRRSHDAMRCGHVWFPQKTLTWQFPKEREQHPEESWEWNRFDPTRSRLQTTVPIVPARFIPVHGLSNYHVLWEVEKWDVITPPRDPMLLKRVSPNVFVVLAGWDLTDVERAVLRGRIA